MRVYSHKFKKRVYYYEYNIPSQLDYWYEIDTTDRYRTRHIIRENFTEISTLSQIAQTENWLTLGSA